MKKLLITTLAAVSVGLCAKAETAAFAENGVSFEESGVPDAGQPLFQTMEVDGQEKYVVTSGWATGASTEDLFIVTNVSGVTYPSRPQMWDGKANTKALAIDTTVPLVRYADGSAGAAQDIATPIFFDSVVQFTATDAATAPAADDKLVVWLYASEGVDADNPGIFGETKAITNLVVTARYKKEGVDADGNPTEEYYPTNYLTNVSVEPGTWHRLTIKAINDIDPTDAMVPGFEVRVDEEQAEGVLKYKDDSETAVKQFMSLHEAVSVGNNVLKGVAFDGKGAVDDLAFTATDPFYVPPIEAENANLKITFNDFSAIDESQGVWYEVNGSVNSYDIETDSTEVTLKVGDNVSVWFSLLEGYELVSPVVEPDEDGFYVITIDALPADGATIAIETKKSEGGEEPEEPEEPAKPTIDGEGVKDADAFIADANSGVTIKVPTGWTLDGNVLKDADGNVYATFADYYTVELATDGTVTLELNDTAKPEINETAADKGDAIVVTDAAVALGVTNAKAGLWYGAQAYSDAACTKVLGGVTGWEKATGETVTVTATKPEGDKAFFKVVVTDIAPESTEE